MSWFTDIFSGKKSDPNTSTPVTVPPKSVPPVAQPAGDSTSTSTGANEFVKGLDVAKYEPEMDYAKAFNEGFRYVFAKASDGSGTKDVKYEYHREESKKAGLIFGSYHFIRLLKMPAKEQAAVFFKATGGCKPGEMIAVDLEWCNEDGPKGRYADGKAMDDAAADFAIELLDEVERLFGVTPVLYTHHYFFTNFKHPERFARFPFWATQPNVDISKVVVPAPWKRWTFWQKTFHQAGLASQNPDGIDADVFNGSLEELKKLVKQ